MAVLGMILMGIGVITALAGGIGILIAAFRESAIWGIGSLIVPLVGLIFIVTHWDVSKKPFCLKLIGIGVIVVGALISNAGHH